MSAPLVTAPSPDPRVGLKAGLQRRRRGDLEPAQGLAARPSPQGFAGITNSDLGFSGTNVIQGNYNGFQIWDISNPTAPRLRVGTLCPASQSDVSVYKNLLFVSAEAPTARLDCGAQAPTSPVSKDRIRGLRIFDITDIDHPKYLANVQTCRGSHTHTVVDDPKDKDNVYVYISGTSGDSSVRRAVALQRQPLGPEQLATSVSKSSRFRSRIRSRRRSSARRPSSPIRRRATSTGLLSPQAHGASPADTAANAARAKFDAARAQLPR